MGRYTEKARDIRGLAGPGSSKLLWEAQKVCVRRDEEKQKAKAKIFVAAVRETQKGEKEVFRTEGQRPRGDYKKPPQVRNPRDDPADCHCYGRRGYTK